MILYKGFDSPRLHHTKNSLETLSRLFLLYYRNFIRIYQTILAGNVRLLNEISFGKNVFFVAFL